MESGGFPRNVASASGTINFSAATISASLTREHALSASHWGILHSFQATLSFETIDPPEHHVVSARHRQGHRRVVTGTPNHRCE